MLTDKVIISTRQAGSEDTIANSLRELGVVVLAMPLIEIHPITFGENTLTAIAEGKYQWLVFTSRNGVKHFFNQYHHKQGVSESAFKTAVFGNRTASTLESFGITANIINQGNSAIDLYKGLEPRG
jgi:uroporphyrinogen-III synthase